VVLLVLDDEYERRDDKWRAGAWGTNVVGANADALCVRIASNAVWAATAEEIFITVRYCIVLYLEIINDVWICVMC
jgi:hypothetical protein